MTIPEIEIRATRRPGRPRGGPSLAERAAQYKLLQERGLTYAEAAEKMGVSQRAVADYARHLREHGELGPISPDITPAQQARAERRQAHVQEYAALRACGVSPGDALSRIGLTSWRGNTWRYEYALRHNGQMPPTRETPRQPSRYRVAVLEHLSRWPDSWFSAWELRRVVGSSVEPIMRKLAAEGVVEAVDGMRYPSDQKVPARRYRLAAAPAVQDATDATPEGVDLKSAWAASTDTARTAEEVPDGR